ncbi:MAG: tRNA 5-methylaminomethyl-2-thiouridine biosynthesis bifunctional protein [Rhodobacteraceae bacterium HLUCCA12]|nr:MAG: tRNA 5-methylaminomethyl-2-thiouridine biosynthesis bifunctional protein [Rhodobacteraceae bacterium HLUCCA12]
MVPPALAQTDLMRQPAPLLWTENGTPVSTRFDDPYFTIGAGLDEARHVFLDGNGLPDRFAPGFHIAELGFGTGLNLLAAMACWTGPGQLRFTSFEAFPLPPDDMARALSAFDLPGADVMVAAWAAASGPVRMLELPAVTAEIHIGDARDTLPRWQSRADAWFLDGFSPARNPELWGETLMAEVARHTVPGGTFATYTAAGHVRRALEGAGFAVTRKAGFGRKKHMTAGRLNGGSA